MGQRATTKARQDTPVIAQYMSGNVGVEVGGIDLRTASEQSFGILQGLLDAHHVLVFRDQDLSPSDHSAFAGRWGPIFVHPGARAIPADPAVTEVYDAHDPVATTWHHDQSFMATPVRISVLVARTLPEAGADTLFANQHLAFEELSPTMQQIVCSLRAVHRRELRPDRQVRAADDEATHPMVIRHPRTRRSALFVNPDYTTDIEGMTPAESAPLLEFLCRHASQVHFTCRHRWRPGDVVVWDNWSVFHAVVPDSTGDRLLEKVTIGGGGAPVSAAR